MPKPVKGKAASAAATATVTGTVKKTYKTITVPKTIKYKGRTYKVTSISKNAFKNNRKLKSIKIKSRTIKKVGKGSLKGIHKKAVIRVPKSKLKAYKKIFKKKGQAKTVRIIKLQQQAALLLLQTFLKQLALTYLKISLFD